MNWDCTIHSTETPQTDLHNLQNMKLQTFTEAERLQRSLKREYFKLKQVSKSFHKNVAVRTHPLKLARQSPTARSTLYVLTLVEQILKNTQGFHFCRTRSPQINHSQTHINTLPQNHKLNLSPVTRYDHQGRGQVQAERGLFPAVNALRNLPVCASHTPIPVLILQLTIGRKEGMTKEKRRGIKSKRSLRMTLPYTSPDHPKSTG